MPTAGSRDKIDGDGQTRDAGKNEQNGKMQGVDNMDTEANLLRMEKLGILGGGRGSDLLGVEKIMVLD